MGQLKILFITLSLACVCDSDLFAQFNINQKTETRTIDIPKRKDTRITNPELVNNLIYSTDAIIAAERRKLRNQRNTFEFTSDILASQSYFSNWAKGGDNTFAGSSKIYIMYKYQKDKLSITNKINARLGFTVVDTMRFKNEDFFEFHSLGEWQINNHWSYSGTIKFRSQFMKGYKSMTNKTLVSDFLSPGNLEVGIGFTYKPLKVPFKLTLSPITGNMLFVRNDVLSMKKLSGIDPGKHIKPSVGPSLQGTYSKVFHNNMFELKSDFSSFYNLRLTPTARWETSFAITPIKFLLVKFYCLAIYDEEAMPKELKGKVQFNYSLSIGLTYKYKNK